MANRSDPPPIRRAVSLTPRARMSPNPLRWTIISMAARAASSSPNFSSSPSSCPGVKSPFSKHSMAKPMSAERGSVLAGNRSKSNRAPSPLPPRYFLAVSSAIPISLVLPDVRSISSSFPNIPFIALPYDYWAQKPPSTKRVSPVTKLEASLARKIAGPTISAGLAVRLIGTFFIRLA